MAEILLTLDVGGSAAKASALSLGDRQLLGVSAAPYPESVLQAEDYDLPQIWESAVEALARGIESLGRPASDYAGVIVSSVRGPVLPVDDAIEQVLPCIKNTDRRGASYARGLERDLGAGALYATTGHWAAPEWGLPKLLWLKDHRPAQWSSVRHLLQFHDWIVHRLAGEVVSELSSAAMSQLLDVNAGAWATELLGAVGIDGDLLPRLMRAGAQVGGLRPEVAARIGLRSGTPVYAGGGDTHLSAAGASGNAGEVPAVVAGSTAPVMVGVGGRAGAATADTYPALVSPHLWPGVWAWEANAGAVGSTAQLLAGLGSAGGSLRDELQGIGLVASAGPDEPATPLTVLAGNPRFSPEGWAAAPVRTVFGLRPEHTGSDVLRGAMEGSCYATRRNLELLQQLSGARWPWIAVTGGMTRWPGWSQLLADVTGREILVTAPELASALGGASCVLGHSGPPADGPGIERFRPSGPAGDAGRQLAAHELRTAAYEKLYRAEQQLAIDRRAGS
jgi:sugar (pentulose or hexulose) kinase